MRLFLILSLLAATPALAQAPIGADPRENGLGQVLMSCVGREVQQAVKINQLEAEIAKLKADAAKPPEAAK